MAVDRKPALTRGLEVLQLEADAIRTLQSRLGASFEEAVRLVLACRGTVVVTGMGKAGLIGQKISATLASTGTPSLSLHPAEALHGDLGRVRAEDLVLALSKSGKTRELLRLLPPLKAIGAKVVALTESEDSPLASFADLTVAMGPLGEACPLGLAPTVTTTALLALGDALAMAVLEGRDFTREEFAAYHPAGDLGRSLMRVGEIMRQGREVPLLRAGATVRDALAVMTETPGRPGAALITTEDGRLLGIFTDGDLRRLAQSAAGIGLDEAIDGHMARSPRFVREGQLVGDALHMVRDAHIDQVPVVADVGDRVVGLIDVQDLLEVRL
ncbi:MAG: KpsF/GutQ family sugar-phosphate isomerase [Planctomycetes bacterium]|nr:KpsF/GutQ family sugar-phosphate isomerase [Planctomycetota bacterium]MBL7008740.1 KpsF/GutQ family sugar-phosphate isomerase [Planctomycetota bacterium]